MHNYIIPSEFLLDYKLSSLGSHNVWNSAIRQLDRRCTWRLQSAWPSTVRRVKYDINFLDLTRDRNLIDEAQLRQEPTDRDIGANKEATDPEGVLQGHDGTKAKSEARNNQGFKIGDEGDLHDLAAGKQP